VLFTSASDGRHRLFDCKHPLTVIFTKASDFRQKEFKLAAAFGNDGILEKVLKMGEKK
jgi:hypothetical protein